MAVAEGRRAVVFLSIEQGHRQQQLLHDAARILLLASGEIAQAAATAAWARPGLARGVVDGEAGDDLPDGPDGGVFGPLQGGGRPPRRPNPLPGLSSATKPPSFHACHPGQAPPKRKRQCRHLLIVIFSAPRRICRHRNIIGRARRASSWRMLQPCAPSRRRHRAHPKQHRRSASSIAASGAALVPRSARIASRLAAAALGGAPRAPPCASRHLWALGGAPRDAHRLRRASYRACSCAHGARGMNCAIALAQHIHTFSRIRAARAHSALIS